jgi:tryptophanyl-tRNA synthetase
VPEAYIPKIGGRVMSLQEPTRKMSKSDPEDTYIAMLDAPEVIRKKLRRAVTDCDGVVRYDPENKPGVSNLMSILSTLSGQSFEAIEADFEGKGYGAFKDAVADCVVEALSPIQARYNQIVSDKAYLQEVMTTSAERAAKLAARTMAKVRKKVGLAAQQL